MRKSTSRIVSLQWDLTNPLTFDDQKELIMPTDIDVFRMTISAKVNFPILATLAPCFCIINSTPITAFENGYKLDLPITRYYDAGASVNVQLYNSNKVILDRRGTDSFFIDNIFLLPIFNNSPGINPTKFFVDIIFEGLVK